MKNKDKRKQWQEKLKAPMKEKTWEELENEIAYYKSRSEIFREELEILHKSWRILLKIEVGHSEENERLRKRLKEK